VRTRVSISAAFRPLFRRVGRWCTRIPFEHAEYGRLAKFLLESSAEGQVANGVVRTKLALTHEDISQLIGTSRESITRTLSEFRKMEIVELKGSTLIIRNKAALGRLVAA